MTDLRAKRFPRLARGRTNALELTTLQSTAEPQRWKPRRPRNLQTSLTLQLPCFSIVFSRLRTRRAAGLPARRQWTRAIMLESPGGFDPPLDLVHLARQCLGDHELEAELLGLFRLQARALTAELSGSPALSLESKAKIAHTTSRLGACGRRPARRQRGVAHRGIGLEQRRPGLGGSARDSPRSSPRSPRPSPKSSAFGRKDYRRLGIGLRPPTAKASGRAALWYALSRRRACLSPRLLYEGAPTGLSERAHHAAEHHSPRKNSFRCPN